jgi:3-methyl-2-oxobutanoate hydroxymethyltransferase
MRRLTLTDLQNKKYNQQRISVLTLYDASFAHQASIAGVDIVFIGDSLGMVLQGQANTLKVSVDEIAYHTEAVVSGNVHSVVMADLPFNSYITPETAAENAGTLIKAGAEIIKIEGGLWLADTIRFLTDRGIPTCAHIGLTPQFIHVLGGFKVQGRSQEQAQELLTAALALEQAGAKLIVLECVPYLVAKTITESVNIPVIGIGAGPYCDGQVLVIYDVLGITPGKPKKFVKNYLENNPHGVEGAIKNYVREVQEGVFPTLENSFE